MAITCSYCKYFPGSKITTKEHGKLLVKHCSENTTHSDPLFGKDKQGITVDTEACEYFHPSKYFFCNDNHQQLDTILCLHRRFNHNEMEAYEDCAECRQFEQEVNPIIQKYFVQLTKPIKVLKLKRRKRKVKPEPELKLKRRKPRKDNEPKLKRRRR
jgi:hypothetical protein